jgi:phosphate transport system permease protein
MILGIARIAGESAPLLFTALNNEFWPSGLRQPTAALPVMIYKHAMAPFDDYHRQAWAAGLVLLSMVLVTNITARWIASRGIAVQKS